MRTYRYRGFHIVPKRDFGPHGYFIKGKFIKKGWIIVYPPGHRYADCNAMPGGTWAQTVREARELVDVFIKAKGRAPSFWKTVHAGLDDEADQKVKGA